MNATFSSEIHRCRIINASFTSVWRLVINPWFNHRISWWDPSASEPPKGGDKNIPWRALRPAEIWDSSCCLVSISHIKVKSETFVRDVSDHLSQKASYKIVTFFGGEFIYFSESEAKGGRGWGGCKSTSKSTFFHWRSKLNLLDLQLEAGLPSADTRPRCYSTTWTVNKSQVSQESSDSFQRLCTSKCVTNIF